jgi:hypothetical protein
LNPRPRYSIVLLRTWIGFLWKIRENRLLGSSLSKKIMRNKNTISRNKFFLSRMFGKLMKQGQKVGERFNLLLRDQIYVYHKSQSPWWKSPPISSTTTTINIVLKNIFKFSPRTLFSIKQEQKRKEKSWKIKSISKVCLFSFLPLYCFHQTCIFHLSSSLRNEKSVAGVFTFFYVHSIWFIKIIASKWILIFFFVFFLLFLV